MLFPHTLQLICARYMALSCAVLACATLTACGGGGGGSNAQNPLTSSTPTGTTNISTGTSTVSVPLAATTTAPSGVTSTPSDNSPTTTISVPGGSKTTAPITSAACANPQASVPPNISAVAVVNYESSGANQNEASDNEFTELGEISPMGLGAGPYYASKVFTRSEIDGLGIPVKTGSLKDISFYHQVSNGELDLAGFQAYRSGLVGRTLLFTTQYSPALPYGLMQKDNPTNRRLFRMTAGQSVTQSFTATTTFADANMANTVRTSTQRIEFVGMDSVNPGGTQTYTACKFTNTEATPTGSQVTTSWYLLGKGILLRSTTEAISTAGIATTTNTTRLVKASQGGNVVYPAFQ
jgi:hypothetical protein